MIIRSFPVSTKIHRKWISRELIVMMQQFSRHKTSLSNIDEYQYIQRSELPTFHFQNSLPCLPIPKLEKTCERYLNAQKPLLTEEQMQHTSTCVKTFLNDGVKLQNELIQLNKKNCHTSYICEHWFDMYLRDRKPLPINYNPWLVFVPESNLEYNTQLVKTTNLLVSAMRFMKSLKAQILKPELYHLKSKKSENTLFYTVTKLLPSSLNTYGAYAFKIIPLDMSQYNNLFNTTRIPLLAKDKIEYDDTGKHVVVLRRGHFYSFDVLDKDGNIIKPKEIAARLKYILDDERPPNEYPIGIFTTSERGHWANIRSHLIDIGNRDLLKKIDSAVFALCLDDEPQNDDYRKIIRTFLHADGTNRWFDKSFSMIVTKDGYAGLNFEHSWGDGVAVLRFFKDVKEDITKKPRFHPEDLNNLQGDSESVEKLQFVLDAKTQNAVIEERKKYLEWTNKLRVDYMIYEGFGKEECKSMRVSPDAIMQLAFQLALYAQEGHAVPTYESCSTALYKHGRTETIRSCTEKTTAVCTAMTQNNDNISTNKIKEMIVECSKLHNQLTKEAAMGQGFDRHLFALRKIAEGLGMKPKMFEDPAYSAINHNILSTSTLSSPAVFAGGFGPVELDGYGIGYMIQEKRLGAVVTSYQSPRNANDYVKSLETAFQDIHEVLK